MMHCHFHRQKTLTQDNSRLLAHLMMYFGFIMFYIPPHVSDLELCYTLREHSGRVLDLKWRGHLFDA